MTAVDDAIALIERVKRHMIDGTPLDIAMAFEICDVLKGLEALREMSEILKGPLEDAVEALPGHEAPAVASDEEAQVFVTSSAEAPCTVPAMTDAEMIEDHGRRLRWPSRRGLRWASRSTSLRRSLRRRLPQKSPSRKLRSRSLSQRRLPPSRHPQRLPTSGRR